MTWRSTWDSLRDWAERRAHRATAAEFTCAQCERVASCGRLPSDDCVEKLEQMERGQEWRYRPVADAGQRGQAPYC